MVYDRLRYHTREVVGGDGDRSSSSTESGTLHTDGFNMLGDDWGVLGLATLTESASAAATCAALLTPLVSARWCHWYTGESLGRGGTWK
jgi:hypothetical protein